MNILGNGGGGDGLPPQLMQSIQQVKGIMGMARGNPMSMLQNDPRFAQVMQMCKGQNPQSVLENMCRQQGINPQDLINALKQ